MRRISTILLFLLLATTLKAQNLVSTDPYKRNAVIEEYTGIKCPNCPDGHRIANELAAEYQDRLFVLNIHAGGYAADASIDFRTEDGNIIGAKANSFPSGNVNRAANKPVSRDLWRAYVEQQVEQMAECNVAGQVIIDKESRKATVTVEVYYTANSVSETNYLNVMMLQDNIIAYQSGSNYNPDQVVGNNYRHMHAFRDAITPTWGEEIAPTTKGTFITKTYEYDIPAKIGSFDVNIDDLEFVAFVTETKNEDQSTTPVLNANKLHYISVSDEDIHPTMLSLGASSAFSCSATQPIDVVINNSGLAELTSLKFEVSVDDAEPTVKTWEGNVVSGQTFKVAFDVDMAEGTHNVNVKIVEANGDKYEASKSLSVNKEGWVEYTTESAETEMTIEVVQDKYGAQITWELLGSDYSVLASGGPYTNLEGQTPIELHRVGVKVPMGECVKFVIKDSKSNGICCRYGDGFYRILNSKGKAVVNGDGDFGAEASCVISIVEGVEEEPEPNPGEGIEEVTSSVNMYPNPVSDKLYIETEVEIEEVVVYDVFGRHQLTETPSRQGNLVVDVANLNSGVYFVKIVTSEGEIVKRFVKN